MRSALVLILAIAATACGEHAGAPEALPVPAVSPSALPSPSAPASPVASPAAAPKSAGAVPEAGRLYVWGADDGIYRYDGTTGALMRVWGASTLVREMAYGAYVLGRHGGVTLLQWDGAVKSVCGTGSFADVSTRGSCAFRGIGTAADDAVYTDSPEGAHGAALPRMLLPADWGATTFAWDWDGLRLAIVRHETRPDPVRGHDSLWVMDIRHGTLRKVFDSASDTSFLSGVRWSFVGDRIAFLEQTSTSNSLAADGVGVHLWVVPTAAGLPTDLGSIPVKSAWVQWTFGDRLAFIRGGGRETWDNKELVVLESDGTQHVVAGSLGAHPTASDRIALAPAWQPVYRGSKLAWIESPATTEASPDYFRGIGPAAQRVAVLDGRARISCPNGVTEGVRWSADGRSVLLLCRAPGVEQQALQIWYAPIGGTARPLVTGLGTLGFGYYGTQPSLFEMSAWSLADQ